MTTRTIHPTRIHGTIRELEAVYAVARELTRVQRKTLDVLCRGARIEQTTNFSAQLCRAGEKPITVNILTFNRLRALDLLSETAQGWVISAFGRRVAAGVARLAEERGL